MRFEINRKTKLERKGKYDMEKLKALLCSAMEVLNKNEAEAKGLEIKLKSIKTPAESKTIRKKIFELRNGILLRKDRLEKTMGRGINLDSFATLFSPKNKKSKYRAMIGDKMEIGIRDKGKERESIKFELKI